MPDREKVAVLHAATFWPPYFLSTADSLLWAADDPNYSQLTALCFTRSGHLVGDASDNKVVDGRLHLCCAVTRVILTNGVQSTVLDAGFPWSDLSTRWEGFSDLSQIPYTCPEANSMESQKAWLYVSSPPTSGIPSFNDVPHRVSDPL